ncbi:beta strand repeat-containing protein [Paraburkholderia sp. BR14374]|uniref:beta strand repeat-containing protein n=1 Tax=Paraburkholderia sp. BR14374 TaxID=3237007 RepID=UPI0034CD1151
MAAAQYYEEVQQAYLAYYGRPADPEGREYWAVRLDNAGGDLNSIINAFGNSNESTALYGGSNTAAQIAAIYQTLFGRQPDAEGLNFYQRGIINGDFTLASVALNIYYGATGDDKAQLDAKLAYAEAFTDAVSESVSAQIAYSGKTATDNARAAVAAVTDTTSEGTAAANLETTLSNINAGAVGQTVTLTTGVDTVTLTGNNNVVNATDVAVGLGTQNTWNGLDSITGTGTGNTLNVATALAINGVPAGATVSGVQTLNVIESVNAPVTLDTTKGFTGLTNLNVTSAGGAVTLNAAATNNVSVTEVPASGIGAGAVHVDGGNNVTVNSNNAVTIGLKTAAAGTVTVTETGANHGGAIQVASGSAVNVTATGNDVGHIEIGDNSGNTPTYVTGAVNVTITNQALATAATTYTANGAEVFGGTTVSVTQNIAAPNVAGTTGTPYTNIGGDIDVFGSTATTSVTVNQSAAVNAVAGVAAGPGVPAVAAVGGVADGFVWVEDINQGTANLGTITSVALNNYSAGAEIDDNALSTLTLSGKGGGVALDNAGLAAKNAITTLTVNANAVTDTAGITDQNIIKTLNVVTGGDAASKLAFADKALQTVNVSGAQNIALDLSGAAGVSTINVSGAAGITTTLNSAAEKFTSTGTGDDVLTIANGVGNAGKGYTGSITLGSGSNTLLAADSTTFIADGLTVDGGSSGHNTISASLVANSLGASIQNFQTLDVSGYSGSLDASLLGNDVSGVAISSGNGGGTLSNLAANVTVTDTSDGDTSAIVLTHAGTSTNSLAVAFADATAAKVGAGTQDLSITSTGDSTVTVVSGGAAGVANTLSLTETDNHLTTLKISGANALTLNLSTDTADVASTTLTGNVASSLTTIDGSAATGALSITAGTSVTTGTAGDSLTFKGLAIHGGTGGDTIENDAANGSIIEGATAANTTTNTAHNVLTVKGANASIDDSASAANDVISLKGANESVKLGTGDSSVTVADVASHAATGGDSYGAAVTFGSGSDTVTDKLLFGTGTDTAHANVLTLSGHLSGNDVTFANAASITQSGALGSAFSFSGQTTSNLTFAQLVQLAAGGASATANTVSWFQFGGNTYVVDTGATPTTTAQDQVIKIAGNVDLSHATIDSTTHALHFA